MDYLVLKWRMFYRVNDLDRDGVMTFKDADLFADRYQEQYKPEGEEAKRRREVVIRFFKEVFFLKNHVAVNEDQYIEEMTKGYTESRDETRKLLHEVILDLVRLFDANGDDKMSQEEYAVMWKVCGIDQLFDRSFLRAFPQAEPGKVLLTVLIDCWAEYMFTDVKGKSELEKPYLYAYRLTHEI